ncbi:MAG: acyltransferase domain-containing protein, partial [Symploca sp. SIO2G7]|nr:acyltransferase domain-containing protein [Symploca sp. SIO2G7]
MIQSRWPSGNSNPSSYRDLLQEATVQIRKLRSQLDEIERRQAEPIAVVGMACRFPGGASTPEAYWKLLRNGVDAAGEVPVQRWDLGTYYDPDPAVPGKMYTRGGSFVDDVDRFDPQFFGISPREAISLDPQQRLLLEVSYSALENAGIPAFDQQGSATGVFVGLSFDDYSQRSVRSGNPAHIDAFSSLGNTRSIAAGRIAYVFGFQGPTMQLDTACSSSLLAVHLASQSLRTGECNLALAGGVSLMLSPEATIALCKLQALSADGRCKTFDAAADGYGRGEGCGVVVLKRLGDAVANQDNILGLIKGTAVNHDGISNGLTAPNGSAQTAVIRQALLDARLEPQQIQYVEAHGTGTSLGDPIELISLNQALGERSVPLLVGSVKTNFGHLEAAAGVAGLIKVILSLQHQQVPPHLHLDTPNPYIPWERLAIQVPTQLTPWPETTEPKRAGMSSFGMSGTNVHIILEEAVSIGDKTDETLEEKLLVEPERPLHLLALSARNKTALRTLAQTYRAWLVETEHALADICFTANTGRSHFNYRLAVNAASAAQMSQRLGHVLETDFAKNHQSADGYRPKKVVFLFTGQGSQYIGMGQELYQTEPVFRDTINHCAAILSKEGIALLEALYPKRGSRGADLDVSGSADPAIPAPHIDYTAYTQPALFAIEYGLAKLWQSWGIEPDCVLGHSIGEYAAACLAGVFSLADGLRLIAARGRLMQSLPTGGAMAAVMASQEQVSKLLSNGVTIAAVNGPQNTVISGEVTALDKVVFQLESQGLTVKKLRVSHAFHSALMTPMLAEFKRVAQAVCYGQPTVDIVSSVTGQSIKTAMGKPSYWVNQIRQPVQFAAAITAVKDGDIFIEIGPCPTLVSMGQRCLPGLEALWLPSLSPGKEQDLTRPVTTDWQTLASSLCRLYEAGYPIDWASFDKAYPRQTVLLPNYPFQRKRYWLEPTAAALPMASSVANRYPLLGQRISLAGDTVRCYETYLPWDQPLVWQDHQVFRSVLLPAAGYLEMALAAGQDIFRDILKDVSDLSGYGLADVSFLQGLWLDEHAPAHLQTVLTRQDLDHYRFEIHSRQDHKWVKHSTGSLRVLSARSGPNFDLTDIQKRLPPSLSKEQFYQRYAARGIDYGTSFQVANQIWLGQGEALAQIGSPPAPAGVPPFQMHPVLLDAGLQLAGATLASTSTPYLPVAVEQFSCDSPADVVWIYAQQRSQTQPVIDIIWANAQHQTVAVLKGLALQAIASPSRATQWLHQVVWQHQPLHQTPGEFLAAPSEVRDAIAPQFTQLVQQSDLITYQALQSELNTLTVAYIVQACSQMGWSPQSDSSSEELAQILDIVPQHKNLFERCLTLLHRAKVLTRVNGQRADRLSQLNLQKLEQQLQQHPVLNAELPLLQRCGENLAAVFQGQADPLALLFPNGDLSNLTQLYQGSVGAQLMNQLVQAAVTRTIAAAERPLRIVEIGGGTGATTASLLTAVAESSQQISYTFTDISPRFTTAAAERFRQFPFVEYALLDIEQSPKKQGFDSNFDLVIAANVLHATADIRQTLGYVGELLAPGGQLVLLEGTQPVGWIDLIFGLTPGWWKFTDRDLRPDHPLLSVSQWQQVLNTNGFEAVAALRPDTDIQLSQSVIIAQATSIPLGHWLIWGSDPAVNELAAGLQHQGQTAESLDISLNALTLAKSAVPQKLVYVLPGGTDVVNLTKTLCQQLLALVQRLMQLPQAPRLYIVSTNDV